MSKILRFMIIGDLIGEPGLRVLQKNVSIFKEKYDVDSVIVNGENVAKNGYGITSKAISAIKKHSVDVITLGNHAFDCKDVYAALDERDDVIRPANFPSGCPGKGHAFFDICGYTVAVLSLQGRLFLKDLVDCPFKTVESLLLLVKEKSDVILIDFHAESIDEKQALGFICDGKASCVFGTHTHVQTADERILPKGSGYITDIGCCGPMHSMIGMNFKSGIRRLMIHPKMGKFSVETNGPMIFNGILLDVDGKTGKTVKIERINVVDHDISNVDQQ
jgi:2',3'-cyclic-nucleotide 2'-phosphodiesterase